MPSPTSWTAILIGVILGCAIGWLIIDKPPSEFKLGYEQGIHHAILYNQATEGWPGANWRDEHYNDDLQTEQDLKDTLVSYEIDLHWYGDIEEAIRKLPSPKEAQ